MSIFSNLFKKRPKLKVQTDIGEFTLVHKSGSKNLWSNEELEIPSTVRGTEKNPESTHVDFLKSINKEIEKLSQEITEKFLKEFREAELPLNFNSWEERLKIVGLEVMMMYENKAYWNLTFEDTKAPYAHFTIFNEAVKINQDFAIDT